MPRKLVIRREGESRPAVPVPPEQVSPPDAPTTSIWDHPAVGSTVGNRGPVGMPLARPESYAAVQSMESLSGEIAFTMQPVPRRNPAVASLRMDILSIEAEYDIRTMAYRIAAVVMVDDHQYVLETDMPDHRRESIRDTDFLTDATRLLLSRVHEMLTGRLCTPVADALARAFTESGSTRGRFR